MPQETLQDEKGLSPEDKVNIKEMLLLFRAFWRETEEDRSHYILNALILKVDEFIKRNG